MTGASTTTAHGSCNLCEAMCGLEFTVADGVVQSIRGDKEDPLSRGHICPKATALVDIHSDPDRLRRPVRRTADGWQEIGWDEAYDLVVDGLVGVREKHGADAVGVYAGNPNVHSLGAMTHGIPFFSMLRTKNRYSATSLDQLPHQLANRLLYGHQLLLPIADIDNTDFFLVLGANPMASNGSMMTVPDFAKRAKALRARGGRMVVIDPRRTETADIADTHYFIRPGTDAYLLLALIHTIISDGKASPAPYVDGLEEVGRAVLTFTPEAVSPVVGIPATDIRALAADLAGAERAAVYGRMGVSTQQYGSVCQWAIQVLNIVTGNLDRVGGTLMTDPAISLVAAGVIGKGHLDKWRSRVRDLPEFAGELPCSTLVDEITVEGRGQIKAMVVASGNPVLSMPGGQRLDEAFAGLDFMVSFDIYVNETSRHADVILPPTSALERDHYDLIFHTFAVRNTAKLSPAVLEPAPGAKHDWEIFRDLALRYAARRSSGVLDRVRSRVAPRALVREVRFRLSPTASIDILLRRARGGLSVKALRKNPHGVDLGPLRPGLPGKLRTRDKRIALMQPAITSALPALAAELENASQPTDSQLLLIGRRHVRSNNSWMHNSARLVKGKPRHHLLAHPDDLAARGIVDGSLARVSSAAGVVDVEVSASEQMMRGVVSLPHGFGHGKPGVKTAVASGVAGPSMNDLTDPNQVDAVSANAILNGIPVEITTAPAAGVTEAATVSTS